MTARRRSGIDRTGRSEKSPRHVRLYHWMMQTAAWKSLSGNQRAIYIEMSSRYHGSNNGRIHFSAREAAAALHIGKTTAARDLTVLQDRGFIVAATRGGFNVKDKQRQATEWRLSEFNDDVTGALPSKEFARWSLEIQNTVPLQNSNVPVAGSERTCGGTETSKNGPERTRGGTVRPVLATRTSRYRYTYSLPGETTSSVPASPAAPDPTPDLSIPDFLRRDLTPIDQSRAENRARKIPNEIV
jgi:hypothetical protein